MGFQILVDKSTVSDKDLSLILHLLYDHDRLSRAKIANLINPNKCIRLCQAEELTQRGLLAESCLNSNGVGFFSQSPC
jgi:hypothetical protein